jgi:hypothetical protein
MYIHLPLLDWIPIVGGPIVAAALFVAAMARAARSTPLPAHASRNVITGLVAFLVAWLVAYTYLGARGAFGAEGAFATLPVALLAPLAVAFVALKAFPNLRAIIDNVPQERLIGIQVIRLMGFAFLLLLAQSRLPSAFALPAGLGDMFVGFEAIFVARLFARRSTLAPAMGLLWNFTGLADFLIALTIGFLGSTTPLQLLHLNPSTDLVTVLPLVMIPTFGIPLFTILHGLSLGRAVSTLRSRTSGAPATA